MATVNPLGILLLFTTFLVSCRPDTAHPGKKEYPKFVPKGDLSDLLYNPVRPDGSIDSSFLPIFQWADTLFAFGEVREGDIIQQPFGFRNVGTAPLLINTATSTCGCTIPEWPKDPIMPGDSGTIRVKFNTLHRTGQQMKQVTIFANTIPNQCTLYLSGRVEPAK